MLSGGFRFVIVDEPNQVGSERCESRLALA